MRPIEKNDNLRVVIDKIKDILVTYTTPTSESSRHALQKESYRGIFEALKSIPNILKIFPENILFQEAQEMFREILMSRTSDETLEKLTEEYFDFLLKEKTYTGYISFEGCKNIPIGKKLGDVTIVEFKDTSEGFRLAIQHLEASENHYGATTTSCGRFEVKSHRIADVQDILKESLSLTCFFLATMMSYPVDPNNAFVIIHGELWRKSWISTDPMHKPRGAAGYRPEYENDFLAFERISTKARKNSLDERILRSITLFGMARLSSINGVSFVLMISALEGLLLSKNDNDFLGTKLAEKIVFLLFKEKEDRLKNYKRVKALYGKRSGFVHGSESNIEKPDVRYAENYYRLTLSKMLELSSTYDKMELKKKDETKEGIEDFINNLRFG